MTADSAVAMAVACGGAAAVGRLPRPRRESTGRSAGSTRTGGGTCTGWASAGRSRPFGLGLHGDYLGASTVAREAFAGLSADLTAFRGGGPGPYLVAGVGGGHGLAALAVDSRALGILVGGRRVRAVPGVVPRVRRGGPLARDVAGPPGRAGAGGRTLVPLRRRAVAAAARRSPFPASDRADLRRHRSRHRPPAASATPAAPLRDSVIATATDAMGRPYSCGGTGTDGGGFDCSGLIQYAYGQHGVALPRTQRRAGREGKAVARARTPSSRATC